MCYLANTGDSRAIFSQYKGKSVTQISNDHKPNSDKEKSRILKNGGVLYQNKGPIRISPGKLSVSRAFGDLHAKTPKFGGKQSVIISDPEIIKFPLENNSDFIFMGSDGVYDQLENNEISKIIWEQRILGKGVTIHKIAGRAVDAVLENAMNSGSLDNVTGVLICFENYTNLGISALLSSGTEINMSKYEKSPKSRNIQKLISKSGIKRRVDIIRSTKGKNKIF